MNGLDKHELKCVSRTHPISTHTTPSINTDNDGEGDSDDGVDEESDPSSVEDGSWLNSLPSFPFLLGGGCLSFTRNMSK